MRNVMNFYCEFCNEIRRNRKCQVCKKTTIRQATLQEEKEEIEHLGDYDLEGYNNGI